MFWRNVAATLVAAGMATSGYAASATGTASVKILTAVTVTKTADLSFGKVVPGTAAATVAIAEAGTRTCGTGLSCSGTVTAAAFQVTGTTGETVTVAIDVPTVSLTSGTNSMSVSLSTTTTSIVLAAGTNAFKVAGTLSVGASQAAGSYTGNFSVSVNYQ